MKRLEVEIRADGTATIITPEHEMTREEVDFAYAIGKPNMRDVIECCLDMPYDGRTGGTPRFGLAT